MASRAILLLALASAVAACSFDPKGSCSTRADCAPGLDCLAGVCAACRGSADCKGWEACGLGGLCAPLAGRCGGDADCAAWDLCDASHTCVLRADRCPNVACTALRTCDPTHQCSFTDGRCAANADCDAWLASCDTTAGRCLFSSTPGDDVLAIGTLVEGSCNRGAISRATTGAASKGVELGYGCGFAPDGMAHVDPTTGGLVYRRAEPAGGDTLRRFRRDWDHATWPWSYPADASANDDVALAPGHCPIAWDRWAMQAGTGKLMYSCQVGGVPPQRDFYDDADVLLLPAVREVLSWNAGGYVLLVDGDGTLKVALPPGAAIAVTALPSGAHLAHRANAAGFRVALHDDATGLDELWQVEQVAAGATKIGTYGAVPGGITGGEGTILDEADALYGVGFVGLPAVVVKRPVLPGTASLVYQEPSVLTGYNDLSAATLAGFKPFLRLDRFLATRP